MVDKIHYRWDFIGLSTDSKPTPAESPKVVDGSTYYESDTSKLYVFYKDTWYEKTATGGGGDITVVQSTGQSTTDVMSQKAVTDMIFYNNNTSRIKIGGDAQVTGTYSAVAIGYGSKATASQTTALGTGAKATATKSIAIGDGAEASQRNSIAIGTSMTNTGSSYSVGIGSAPWSDHCVAIKGSTRQRGSIAIGEGSLTTSQGQFDIGSKDSTDYGYNNSNYRLLTGLYDPQNAHDAATKGYVDTKLGSLTLVSLTQSAYDALATKDPNTLYIITGA